MTIRRKLIISNLLMVIVPALLVIVLSVGALLGLGWIYWETLKSAVHGGEGITVVKNVIDAYGKENASNFEKPSLQALQQLISTMGYHIQTERNGTIIYSTFTDEDLKIMEHIPVGNAQEDDSIIYVADSIALVRNSYEKNGTMITITVLNLSAENPSLPVRHKIQKIIRDYLWIVLVVTILIIALTNGILAGKISKSILRPLDELSKGVREIKNGNLDFPLTYSGKDEFQQVCADFDEMRLRLKASVETQLAHDEEKREFIAGISHDLRTPLTTIQGYVEGLRDGVANTPEKQARYLNTIYRKIDEMNGLVDHFFHLSKLETGHFPFHFEWVDINDWLNRWAIAKREELDMLGIHFLFENRLCTKSWVSMDTEQMTWVLENIVCNSVKYAGQNSQIILSLYATRKWTTITLSDDGPGVPIENLSKIFQTFYRFEPSRSNGGSGLGLAIAKRIVEGHNGTITAESKRGLTIIIKIPSGYSIVPPIG